MPDAERSIDAIRAAFPEGGLFADKDWLVSPQPLALPKKVARELETLGHQLALFVRAADTLYRQSAKGRAPAWLAAYLDAGKPAALVEQSRHPALVDALPRVIRPDLLWTDEGFAITELDNLPGGIGLTAWLNRTYASLGHAVLGGGEGMVDGFASILPRGGDIAVSEESADYRPEMEWLAAQLNGRTGAGGGGFEVCDAETYAPRGRDVYRFYELFDLDNIPSAEALFGAAAAGEIALTAPHKPYLEEKLWSALFWSRPLRGHWAKQMRAAHIKRLETMFPRSWVVDPAPVPHHAELPGLGITEWSQMAEFSQKERALVLKISGFSELAWGSRSVRIGEDLPAEEWSAAIERAVGDFPEHPWVLQQFRRARVFEHPFWDEGAGEVRTMPVRARLCPYYFLAGDNPAKPAVTLGGVLATLVPSDKKVIHGMRDGILVPCVVEG